MCACECDVDTQASLCLTEGKVSTRKNGDLATYFNATSFLGCHFLGRGVEEKPWERV